MRDFSDAKDALASQRQQRLDLNRSLEEECENSERDLKDRIAAVRSILNMAQLEQSLLSDITDAVERYQAEAANIREMEDEAVNSDDIEYDG